MAFDEVRPEADESTGPQTLTADAVAAAAKRYPVAPGVALKVRSGPGTQYDHVRTLPVGASVRIFCQKPGQAVKGPYGTSRIWDNIGNGEFVSDAYVRTGSDGYVAIRC
ncbi:peptidase [Streptomyces sp. NPDC047315]|uniref:peptidase n=1 Tax=Streptomyces sp. NPDC047315 TaxID=3155142 RepID=UPI0033EC10CD